MNKSLIALAAAIAAFAVTPASAGSVQIKYSDLNLASVEGQKTLEQRISAASKKVCGYGELKTGTRSATADMKRCFAKAKSSATAQVASATGKRSMGG